LPPIKTKVIGQRILRGAEIGKPVKYENFTTFDIKIESAIAAVISYLGAVNA